MDEQQSSSNRTWLIAGGVAILLLIGIGVFLFLPRGNGNTGLKSITSLFGNLGTEIPRPTSSDIQSGTGLPDGTASGDTQTEEPLFRQLANIPVAGATSLTHNGQVVVRYVEKAKGYTYEVDPVTGKTTQLTNRTIPQIYEAYWGNSVSSVV